MAKKSNWNADAMQGSLISDMEQEVKSGYRQIGQGGGEPSPEMAKPTLKTSSEITAPAQPIAQTAPQEPTQNINVPIPESLHRRLGIIKYQTKRNMKQLVVDAIREYVEKHDVQ